MFWLAVISTLVFLLCVIFKDFIKGELEFHFYARQGIAVPAGRKWFIGHVFKLQNLTARPDEKEFQMNVIGRHDYEELAKKYSYPDAFLLHLFQRNIIFLCHQDLFQELLLAKNKYYDKHPYIEQVLLPLIGRGLVFVTGDLKWQQQRKSLSSAFYKQKLIQSLILMNDVTDKKIDEIRKQYADTGVQMDLLAETSKLLVKIVLVCIFNDEEVCETLLPYTLHGQTEYVPLSVFLQKSFQELFKRSKKYSLTLFPGLLPYYLTKYDKEVLANCIRIRDFIQNLADRRREKMKEPGYVTRGDLLETLLEDELFANNNEVIIDQTLTFFFAATQTIFYSTSNVIMFAMQDQRHLEKIREEYKEKVLDSPEPLYDKIQDLSYYGRCYYEAMRLETPVKISSSSTVSEDCQIGPYFIKKGTHLILGLDIVNRSPEQWQEPEKYLPERFDPQSPLYLTPSGEKRHPYTFCPFLGGSRICIGKTFAETATKVVGPKLIYNFNFDFVDKSHYKKKPLNNIGVKEIQKCYVHVESRI